MARTLTERQIQILRRRKIRAIESKRDQAMMTRDKANSDLRKYRQELQEARAS